MKVEAWLKGAIADANERGLPELEPLLEGLAASTARLRSADFNQRADGTDTAPRSAPVPDASVGPASPAMSALPARVMPQAAVDTPHDPSLLDIEAFGRRLRLGATSALEATNACLRRIDEQDGELNAFILVMADEARAQAREADAELAIGHDRGPLHGVPLSLKDLFDVRGHATTAASNVRRHHVAARDADAVLHLRRAGAVIVGKTNLHEFAFGTTNEDSAFGPARHPLDHGRSPGGSSGGSAVSVAAGMAMATLGTDTGGSIRIPSAVCGLVGLKPAAGEVSTSGVVPLSTTLDHVGPIARSVTDAWHVYQALLGHPVSRPLVPRPLAGARFAVPRRYFCEVLQPDVRTAFEAALERLGAAGATINDVEVAHADHVATIYLHLVFGEAAAYHAATLESMPLSYTAAVRLRLDLARYVLAEDYQRALHGQRVLRREIDEILASHDAVLLPTLPITAPVLGQADITIDGTAHPVRNLMLRLTQPFNITGHPAISVPIGTGSDGLPIGLQVVAGRDETAGLMQTALAIEDSLKA